MELCIEMKRLLRVLLLFLCFLHTSAGLALEDGCSSFVLDGSTNCYTLLREKAAGAVSSLLSVPVETRTFENFVLPWYRLKFQIQNASCDAQQNKELFDQIMHEIDPCAFALTAIKDVSEILRKKVFLNTYQEYLLQKIRSEFDCEQDLLFFEEDGIQLQGEKISSVGGQRLSLLNCAIPLDNTGSFDETIVSIIETGADVVCIHDIKNEETRYRIYEALRERYGYFCLEASENGGALIASRYSLSNEKKIFLDDRGMFFEVSIHDPNNEIGRIIMARSDCASSSEQLSSLIEVISEKIRTALTPLSEPVLFCGNFSKENLAVDALNLVSTEYFGNGGAVAETTCNLLLSTYIYSLDTTCIPLSDRIQGLLSVVSLRSIDSYCGWANVQAYPAECDVSGSAGYDCSRGSYGEASLGYSNDSWSVSVHGDVHRDKSGQTSGGVRVDVSGHW